MRAKAQIDKKGDSLTKEGMAPHLGAHLCRCTGYVKILDAIDAVAHGRTFEPSLAGDGRRVGREVRGGAADARRPRLHRRPPRARDAARRAAPHRARPGRHRRHRSPPAALAAPGVEAVFTAADLPGELRVGIIYKDWPVMIPVGGRTSYAGDVLAIVVADTRAHARAAAELVEVTYERARAEHRSGRGPRRRCAALGVGHRQQRAVDQRLPARRRLRRRLRGERVHGPRDVRHATHRARLPRARIDARRAERRRRRPPPARVLGRSGRVGRPQRHRQRPRRSTTTG